MASSPTSGSQAPAPPAGQRRHDRKTAIVEAAARLFAELGYTDCEMERLAAELGIAKGTLYLYFPSKEELFYACADAGMRQMQQAVFSAMADVTDGIEQIRRSIKAYLEFFDAHPEQVELIIQERANFKHRKRPTYFEYRAANRQTWRALYTALREQGRIRSDLPLERMLDTVGNLLYGTMFTNFFAGRPAPLIDQYESILEILLDGIATSIDAA